MCILADKNARRLKIEGTVTDEQSKAALTQKLVAAISAETQRLVHQ